MGGLLTFDLARRYPADAAGQKQPEIVAISTLATPLFCTAQRASDPQASAPSRAAIAVRAEAVRSRPARAQSPQPPLKPLGMPIRCLDSLLDLMAHVRTGLPAVRQPALLCHGVLDHTAPYASLAAIAGEIGTPPAALQTLPRSYHLLPLDVEREQVLSAVAAHLAKYL